MADYQYITETGVIVPDTGDLLETIQDEFKEAIASDLIVQPSTPQGLMITAETVSRDAVVRNNAALANQINPNIAGGVFLDSIGALTGLDRVKGTKSIIEDVLLTGESSTVIPSGSLAQTIAGDIFQSINSVVLDGSGMATVDFQSVEIGPIGAAVNDLNQIVAGGALGWENVQNSNAAILGANKQSDQSYRALRRVTLALQGVSITEAITSSLYVIPGVKSLAFRENYTNVSKTIDGITLLPNSVYACVDGGLDIDIANALLENKSAGANWNGNTTVIVTEPASGQPYEVKFSRPDEIEILIKVTVKADQSTLDPQTTVRNAIMDYVNGLLEGEPGFVVGGNVSSFELAGAINRNTPGIYVSDLKTTKLSVVSYSSDEIPIAIYEVARTSPSNIQVILT